MNHIELPPPYDNTKLWESIELIKRHLDIIGNEIQVARNSTLSPECWGYYQSIPTKIAGYLKRIDKLERENKLLKLKE